MSAEMKNRLNWVFPISAIVLLIAGFLVPPMGVVDGSVLIGASIIFAFATLYKLPEIIKTAGSVKLTAGQIQLEANAKNKDTNE